MPTRGANVLTLTDWAKRLDPDGKTARVVELLAQTNEIVQDMPFMEGNLPTGHRITVRTGYPTPVWRLLNQGVAPTKTTTAQIDEQTGMLEDWTEVDVDLAELNGNTAEFRLSEAQGKIEALSQEAAQTIFYGNSATAQEEFTGLAPRYSSLSANNAQNVIDAGGTGADNSSMWLIGWAPDTVYGIFPKGSKAGIMHEDLGKVTVETTAGVAGNRMRAYQDHWQWKLGLCVKDWRYAVRIANIDISNLVTKTGAADLGDEMIRAFHRIPQKNRVRLVWYANRTVIEMLDIQRRDDALNGGFKMTEVDGVQMMNWRGIPIHTCDALVETEAQVV